MHTSQQQQHEFSVGVCIPYLTENEDFVAAIVQALEHTLQQLHLATLGPNLLRGRVSDAAIEGPLDEVRVVAVLAHLHEDVVQLGHADVGSPL